LSVAGRHGINPSTARTLVRTNNTVIGALAVKRGEADALLCGLGGKFVSRLRYVKDIIGVAPGVGDLSSMSLMVTNKGAFFLADTHVRLNPTAAEIAENALLCAVHVRRFGLKPKIALISHSDFGSDDAPSAIKMRAALELIRESAPDLEVDGEMQADTALSQEIRNRVLPGSRLKGEANVLVMPDLASANIAFQMTKMMADALPVGPILLGAARPVHILTPSITARGVVNMTAVAVAEAQQKDEEPDMA
jgi:malate dehydrogenase (oxaloacetate-decarboxylating)(NADP+)